MFLGYYPSLCLARVFSLFIGGGGVIVQAHFSSLFSRDFRILVPLSLFRFLYFVFLFPLFAPSPSFLSSFSCSPVSFHPASFLSHSSFFFFLYHSLSCFCSHSFSSFSFCSLPYFFVSLPSLFFCFFLLLLSLFFSPLLHPFIDSLFYLMSLSLSFSFHFSLSLFLFLLSFLLAVPTLSLLLLTGSLSFPFFLLSCFLS